MNLNDTVWELDGASGNFSWFVKRYIEKLVEEKFTSTNIARKEILLCSYTGFCLANQHGICTDACFCNCQRKTSSIASDVVTNFGRVFIIVAALKLEVRPCFQE